MKLYSSTLEYCSVIRALYHLYHMNNLETMQYRFLRLATLFRRLRPLLNLFFARKIPNDLINCPEISRHFSLRISRSSIRHCPKNFIEPVTAHINASIFGHSSLCFRADPFFYRINLYYIYNIYINNKVYSLQTNKYY